jgi:oligopeptide transport system ATP-binding protein
MSEPLLRVEALSKHFPVTKGVFSRVSGQVRAVDEVSFELARGETLGLVGESGCGKSTVGRTLLRLHPPTAGKVWFEGRNLADIGADELQRTRRDMQIVFQDPYSSLNPRMRVFDIVGEALQVHGIARGEALRRRVFELLDQVGVSARWADRYAHEFSGGQRQRIGIARAIALNPKLLVCDEAVSALDVSIQAQIINLLIKLREQLGLSYLFISHDLSVVRHISHRVMVMYLGQVVELGPTADLFAHAAHPYTRALLSAVPSGDPRQKPTRVILEGDVPSPLDPPAGCRFHTRCPAAFDRCSAEAPRLYTLGASRSVRCFHAEGLEAAEDWYVPLVARLDSAERDRRDAVLARAERRAAAPAPELFEEPEFDVAKFSASPPPDPGETLSWARRSALFVLLVGVSLAAVVSARSATKSAVARQQLTSLETEIRGYRVASGELPPALGDLGYRLGFVFGRARASDPWGSAYRYEPAADGGQFVVSSSGPDRAPGTKDDLVVTGAVSKE